MKIKQDPDDFRVVELTEVRAGPDGPFAFYRLEKRGWTTTDAVAAIRRRWNLPLPRVAWGGLKDRHAATTQYLTIYRGPRRGLEQTGLRLEYLGQTHHAYSSRAIFGNRFDIVLRSLSGEASQRAIAAIDDVRDSGVPNYFDDQRFGSVGDTPDFIARRMVRGEFERALYLALAEPSPHDRAPAQKEKALLREYWNRWPECKAVLPRGHARSLVDYLCHHPTDFRGACGRLRPDLQGLYLSAYQSYLWNRIAADWIRNSFPVERFVALELRLGSMPAPRRLAESEIADWQARSLPLPAARWPLDATAAWAPSAERVLADDGLAWVDLKIRGLRKPFFTRGERALWVVPQEIVASSESDDRNPGRQALSLQFSLPRGSYATLIVKRLSLAGASG